MLTCASVDASGNVTLEWTGAIDPSAEFINYEIFDANTNTLLTTINDINAISFTVNGAGAELSSKTYYIVTNHSGAGSQVNSTNLSTVFLKVESNSGIGLLEWSSPNQQNNYKYYVERETSSMPDEWVIIDSSLTASDVYRDTVLECFSTYRYRIRTESSSFCSSFSNIETESIADENGPYKPVVTSVSVDTSTGGTVIEWNVNSAADTRGYEIFEAFPDDFRKAIDTALGINNTSYTDFSRDPTLKSQPFGVLAFDDCLSGINPTYRPSSPSSIHKTIFLSTTLDTCAREVGLVWTNYFGWPTGVESYEVYMVENNEDPVLLSSQNGMDSTYLHQGVNSSSSYSYFVKAIQSGSSKLVQSFSNKNQVVVSNLQVASYLYLSSVSVEEKNQLTIGFIADPVDAIVSYRLEKATTESGPYETIESISSNPSGQFQVIDQEVETSITRYYYRVISINDCGVTVDTSNIGTSLLLKGDTDDQSLINSLQWNGYKDWQSGVNYYNIYRGTTSNLLGGTLISSISGEATSYQDDVSDLLIAEGKFCYYIEAVEGINGFDTLARVKSNIKCIFLEPEVWVPNAFTPNNDNVNDVFKPVTRFVQEADFIFEVYNRWNQKIFESRDLNVGWDGTYKSKAVKEGVYMYIINFRSAFGNFDQRTGIINVFY